MVNYVELFYGYLEGLDSMTWASQADMLDLAMNVTDTSRLGCQAGFHHEKGLFFHTMWKTYGRPMENHGKPWKTHWTPRENPLEVLSDTGSKK